MTALAYMPSYVTEWTDKYFHQSAFDVPVNYPNKKVLKFLASFSKPKKVRLFRGINKYNKDNGAVASWTYNRQIAEGYAKDVGGKIIEKEFLFNQILLDTTLLTKKEKQQFGYDYKIDDKEVLILEI